MIERLDLMSSSGIYFTVVIIDKARNKVAGYLSVIILQNRFNPFRSGTVILEHKFIRDCGMVSS